MSLCDVGFFTLIYLGLCLVCGFVTLYFQRDKLEQEKEFLSWTLFVKIFLIAPIVCLEILIEVLYDFVKKSKGDKDETK